MCHLKLDDTNMNVILNMFKRGNMKVKDVLVRINNKGTYRTHRSPIRLDTSRL